MNRGTKKKNSAVERAVKAVGGPTKAAGICGVSNTAIHKWIRRGSVTLLKPRSSSIARFRHPDRAIRRRRRGRALRSKAVGFQAFIDDDVDHAIGTSWHSPIGWPFRIVWWSGLLTCVLFRRSCP